MKFEKTNVWGFDHAIRGARNPFESWGRSDSDYCFNISTLECDKGCPHVKLCSLDYTSTDKYIIGENDLDLMQRLIKASIKEGNSHTKFLRQIMVSVDITAPQFWWSEFDTYKVGTVANSTSKMHRLSDKPITIDCFEPDCFDDFAEKTDSTYTIITILENLRQEYRRTKNKKYWYQLLYWLPQSWLQTRTVTLNYQNIRQMYFDRRNHKINQWSGKDDPNKSNFVKWINILPYAKELIMYMGE